MFEVNEEAIKFLDKIEGPICPITIVGASRKGKSLLLNLLIDHLGAFEVGNFTNGCTKGLWLYNKVKKVKNKSRKL